LCRFIISVGLSNRDINDSYEGNHSIRKPPAELDPAESSKHARKTRERDDNRDFSSKINGAKRATDAKPDPDI